MVTKKHSRVAVSQISTPAVPVGGKSNLKGKAASLLAPTKSSSVKDRSKHASSEATAVVVAGGETIIPADAISISSDDGAEQEAEEDAASDIDMADADSSSRAVAVNGAKEDADEEDDAAEPSFGELLRAQPSEPVDIAAALDGQAPRALVSQNRNGTLQAPSGVSLATVLNQALKTNDSSLLESCFLTTDIDIVRATIMRMDSTLAAVLLQKLAERLARSPGRYGSLLLWVQWVCVAHGGAIAGQQEMLRKMKSLFRTMDERAASLSSLLLLKGKLDMLDAQMGLRSSVGKKQQEESDDEEQVIYIEGQEELEDSDDDGMAPIPSSARKILGNDMDIDDMSEDDVSGDEEGEENLIDDEAEESQEEGSSDNEESLEEDEGVDSEEDAGSLVDFVVDSEDEEEDLEEAEDEPPAKKSRLQRGSKNRA